MAALDDLAAYVAAVKAAMSAGSQRRTYKTASALVTGITGGAYVTVVDFTPTGAIVVSGYNADFRTLVNARYRMRFAVGGITDADVRHAEEVTTDANAWVPLYLSVAAGERLRVQVMHAEVTAQDVRATINYYEES